MLSTTLSAGNSLYFKYPLVTGLSFKEARIVIDEKLALLGEDKGYIYYEVELGTDAHSMYLDDEAKKQGVKIHPYTRKPVTKDEAELQNRKDVAFNKLLKELRGKQEECWKRIDETDKEK